jgi:hypothetical protein
MKVIENRVGKTKRGVTIHFLKQKSKQKSLTLTVAGTTVQEAYNQIKAYFKILETNPKEATITWKQKPKIKKQSTGQ